MPISDPARIQLTTVAEFPKHYFLENLAVREDGSLLVTVLNKSELWYVPPPVAELPVKPLLICRFDQLPMGIAEVEPDIFCVSTIGDATVERFDMRGWAPGQPVRRKTVVKFANPDARLNGCCLIAPGVLAVADCAEGLIWRVDLTPDGESGTECVWLQHPSMAPDRDLPEIPLTPTIKIPFLGINGIRFAPESNRVYYTSTSGAHLMRVAVDPASNGPAGEPELVASGVHAVDDFCVDEQGGVAYLCTHIDHTIHRVPLAPSEPVVAHSIVLGSPFDPELVGPASLVWGRGPFDQGHTAYLSTDGGHVKPAPDGIIRASLITRLQITA